MVAAPLGGRARAAVGRRGQQHDGLGNGLVERFHSRPVSSGFAQPRGAAVAGAEGRNRFQFRSAGDLGGGGSARWNALRRHRQPRARLPHRPRRRVEPALDGRSTRGVRARHRPRWGALRRHVAGRESVSHPQRQGRGVLRAAGALHLVAGRRARWRALRRHRRSGQDLPRRIGRQGRGLLRYRASQRDGPGAR